MIAAMKAAILAVGSELLGNDRLDTNSLLLAEVLERFGVSLVAKGVVGDRLEDISAAIVHYARTADILLVTGGLGPTEDDLTRHGVAHALGRGVEIDDSVIAGIEKKFASFGMEMPEVNRRQAEVIEGAELIANRRGTAPGLQLEFKETVLFLFPGVPDELVGMIEHHLTEWLEEHAAGTPVSESALRVACLPESTIEERILPVYEEFGSEGISILPSPGDVLIRIRRPGEKAEEVGVIAASMRDLLGEAVYSDKPNDRLEQVVGSRLRSAGATLATAESCTGGLVGERLTRVPGSSEFYLGGVVSYSNAAKIDLLSISEDLIEAEGAVSEAVVCEMAEKVRERFDADYGIGISGVAGPGGGTDAKPVGTVHMAVAGRGKFLTHQRVRFPGDRERVRWLAAQWSLNMLRRTLQEVDSRAGDKSG